MSKTKLSIVIAAIAVVFLVAYLVFSYFQNQKKEAAIKQINDSLSAGTAALKEDNSQTILDTLNIYMNKGLESQRRAREAFEKNISSGIQKIK